MKSTWKNRLVVSDWLMEWSWYKTHFGPVVQEFVRVVQEFVQVAKWIVDMHYWTDSDFGPTFE
jgi:hypothetical protein